MQQQRVSSQVVSLPPMGNLTPQQEQQKSLIHWVWFCYKAVSNMAPWGIASQLGYRDKRWTAFDRCVPYPLGNLVSSSVDRRAVAEIHDSGFSLSPTAIPQVEHVKYAQDQAAELGETYRDEGFRVLTPFTGIEDQQRVFNILQVVQPFAYSIVEMLEEFTTGAAKRIAESSLSKEDKQKATELADVMLRGAQAAELFALREYEELITSMSDAQVGKPGRSNPTKHDEWVCQQLGKDVPERINRMASAQGNSKGIDILVQRALREDSAFEELEKERAARKELEERFARLEANMKQNNAAVKASK